MRDSAPGLAENYIVDRRSMNPELLCQEPFRGSLVVKDSDPVGLVLSEFCPGAPPNVDGVRNGFDVIGPHASRIAAQMVEFHLIRYRSMRDFPVDAMCYCMTTSSLIVGNAVSKGTLAPVPDVAFGLVSAVNDVIGRFVTWAKPPLSAMVVSWSESSARRFSTAAFAEIRLHIGSFHESILQGRGVQTRALHSIAMGGRI